MIKKEAILWLHPVVKIERDEAFVQIRIGMFVFLNGKQNGV
tara:strand:+ start:211 stop:333 length:123 start_codon:yes stop_codon:yes gene_type:complete